MPETYALQNSRGVDLALALPNVRLRAVDGLGMPDVRHITEQYVSQDGESYLDSRLERRIVTLAFYLVYGTEIEMWQAREDWLKIVKVLGDGFHLRVLLPTGATRQLDLRYDSAFSLARTLEMGDAMQMAVLQCVAHNPLWYDPVSVLWSFSVGGGAGTWYWEPLGLGFPAGWGASAAPGTPEAHTYLGTWKAYPTITLTGPMTEPIITNHTTNEVLEFITGYVLGAGETIVIDLRPGYKTVTHSVDGNIPDQLTDDSDLGTWHIDADPEAVGGVNQISVGFTNGTAASRAEIRFFSQYVGI